MLKLKNVSKFYHNNGVIAAGFSKVSIDFKIGEFVAIVGESGSGKSTLLNVISGLDSYEEGEMYINDEETSHYSESDFEEYRKKYVSNIFQNFNLVNSYTVYQNVELVLLLNGYKREEIKEKVLSIIDQVGLSKYKNTKASKLSGGQKQRVAIARALAKETPIIVCDEPTGNLDSRAAKGIIKLLSDISYNKLVIVVTHNISEIENLATRIVRMHDGKIVSDKKIKEIDNDIDVGTVSCKNIGLFNTIRLGFRNTFNIFSKFALMFSVFLFITVSLLSVYGSLKKSEYENSKNGNNYYFNDLSDTRIVIRKTAGSTINSDDLENIKKINNVENIAINDLLLDKYLWFQNENGDISFNATLNDISFLNKKISYGKMPEADNEVLIEVSEYDYYFNERLEDALSEIYYLNGDKSSFNLKVVGVVYSNDLLYSNSIIYGSSKLLNNYMKTVNREYSNVVINTNNKNYNSYNSIGDNFTIVPSDKVISGCSYVSENINYICSNYDCKNKNLNIMIDNLYYSDKLELKICNVYNDKNVNKLLDINKDDYQYGSIFMNLDDYNSLFDKGVYQSSVFVNDVDNIDDVSNLLENMGYETLQIRKTLNNDGSDAAQILKIIKLIIIIILVLTLFFISYFVIKLILKSRNIYFSTLRILGGSFKQVKRITDVELLINSSLAYFSYICLMILVSKGIFKITFISNILEYLKLKDYILMYIILACMSYLISTRFASKIFSKSALKSYREDI